MTDHDTTASPRSGQYGAHGLETSGYQAPRWLRNGHAQTLWPALLRRAPRVGLEETTLELSDGDFLQLAWGPRRSGAVVLVLHGLGGSARSAYVLGLVRHLAGRGLQTVVMEFRGAGRNPNRLRRFFHAGAWQDLDETVKHVRRQQPGRPLAVVGFSMGGIVTLNWLGARGEDAEATVAVVVSTPLDLAACARHLDCGFARLYQWELVRNLKRMVRRKQRTLPDAATRSELERIRTLWEFDDRLTGPLHGFRDAADYYHRCSPGQRLGGVRRPTLLLQAADDPFIPVATLPATLPAPVHMRLSRHGGHVGFINGVPWRPGYWLEGEIADYLECRLAGQHTSVS